MSTPILSLIGRSGSGKTTLLEKLIPELKQRGYRVATIKHHAHPGFEIDIPGKDTWRHARAGSDHVVLAAPDRLASIRRLEHPLTLDQIAAGISDVDLILTEGFKRAGKPALEVMRTETGLESVGDPEQVRAVASDTPLESRSVIQFSLENVTAIADWIEKTFLT